MANNNIIIPLGPEDFSVGPRETSGPPAKKEQVPSPSLGGGGFFGGGGFSSSPPIAIEPPSQGPPPSDKGSELSAETALARTTSTETKTEEPGSFPGEKADSLRQRIGETLGSYFARFKNLREQEIAWWEEKATKENLKAAQKIRLKLLKSQAFQNSRELGVIKTGGVAAQKVAKSRTAKFLGGLVEEVAESGRNRKKRPTIELETGSRDFLDQDTEDIIDAQTIDVDLDILGTNITSGFEEIPNGGFGVPVDDFLGGFYGPTGREGRAPEVRALKEPLKLPGGLTITALLERPSGEVGYRTIWQGEQIDWFPKE